MSTTKHNEFKKYKDKKQTTKPSIKEQTEEEIRAELIMRIKLTYGMMNTQLSQIFEPGVIPFKGNNTIIEELRENIDFVNDEKYNVIPDKNELVEEMLETYTNTISNNGLTMVYDLLMYNELKDVLLELRKNVNSVQMGTISPDRQAKIDFIRTKMVLPSKQTEITDIINKYHQTLQNQVEVEQLRNRSEFERTIQEELEKIRQIASMSNIDNEVANLFTRLNQKAQQLGIVNFNYDYDLNDNLFEYSYNYAEMDLEPKTLSFVNEIKTKYVENQKVLTDAQHTAYQNNKNVTEEETFTGEKRIAVKFRNLEVVSGTIPKSNHRLNSILQTQKQLTVVVLKNNLKIQYNRQLKDELRKMRVKLSVVNKNTKQELEAPEQSRKNKNTILTYDVTNPKVEDYKIRITDAEGKENYVIEADLANFVEESHGRRK